MKLIIALALALVAAAIAYEGTVDNLDADELISNDRLLKSYVHCFMEGVECTSEASEILQWLTETVETHCAKCTEKQKILLAKFIKAVAKKFQPEFEVLLKKYDPDTKYQKNLATFLEKYGN